MILQTWKNNGTEEIDSVTPTPGQFRSATIMFSAITVMRSQSMKFTIFISCHVSYKKLHKTYLVYV